MSTEESEKQARFVFARDRHQYLVARALLRTVLSSYTEVPPEAWVFAVNAFGKPRIAAPADLAVGLEFNLSHTAGMVVCGVTRESEIGVDVEATTRPVELTIARDYFSAAEVAQLTRVPSPDQLRVFYEFWTLKEAYIKARGMGLSLPLDGFSIDLGRPGAEGISISFAPTLDDDPTDWQFLQCRPTEEHLVAVAVRRSTSLPIRLILHKIIP
jgi:4'-phosphopantetheinyl transferase